MIAPQGFSFPQINMTAHIKFIDNDLINLRPTLAEIIQLHSKCVIEEKFSNSKGKNINKIRLQNFLELNEITAFEVMNSPEKNPIFSENYYNLSIKKIKDYKAEETLKLLEKLNFNDFLKILNFNEENVEIYKTTKMKPDFSKQNDVLDFTGFLLYRMQLLKNHQVIF